MNPSPSSTHEGPSKRWWLWLPLLALGAWLALFGDKTPAGEEPVAPARSATAPTAATIATGDTPALATAKTSVPSEALIALVPRDQLLPPRGASSAPASAGRDLFSTRSWTPPAPPPPPVTTPAPMAPPLPFSFVGKKLEGSTWEVYLALGDRTLLAREGMVLEGQWRVDQVKPPSLLLTYLPLAQAQALPIGDTR